MGWIPSGNGDRRVLDGGMLDMNGILMESWYQGPLVISQPQHATAMYFFCTWYIFDCANSLFSYQRVETKSNYWVSTYSFYPLVTTVSEIIDVFLTLVRKLVSQALVVQSFFWVFTNENGWFNHTWWFFLQFRWVFWHIAMTRWGFIQ